MHDSRFLVRHSLKPVVRHGLQLIVLSACLAIAPAYSATNLAMSQFLNDIRGTSFNMLIAEPNIVLEGRKNKTRKAINQGYDYAIDNMSLLLKKLELKARLLPPSIRAKSKTHLKGFQEADSKVGSLLSTVIKMQTEIWADRLGGGFTDELTNTSSSSDSIMADSDDIGADIDIDIDALVVDISEDEVELDAPTALGESVVKTKDLAKTPLIEIGHEYATAFKRVGIVDTFRIVDGSKKKYQLTGRAKELKDIYAPYRSRQAGVEALPVHAVFGASFTPSRHGALHMMEMIMFIVVNDLELKQLRIAAKPIPKYKWNRNKYYISAATGTVLRQIFSDALGAKIADN